MSPHALELLRQRRRQAIVSRNPYWTAEMRRILAASIDDLTAMLNETVQ